MVWRALALISGVICHACIKICVAGRAPPVLAVQGRVLWGRCLDALCVAFSECKSLFRGPIDGVMYAEHARCKDGSIMMVVFDIVRRGLVDRYVAGDIPICWNSTSDYDILANMELSAGCQRQNSNIGLLKVFTMRISVGAIKHTYSCCQKCLDR